jgi:hypothetical protein
VTRKLKVPRKARAAIRLALRRHWRVEANVTLRVRDGAGNVAVKRRAIELKL